MVYKADKRRDVGIHKKRQCERGEIKVPSIKCPSCGHRILHSTVMWFCTNCGAQLAAEETKAAPPEEVGLEPLPAPGTDEPPELIAPPSPFQPVSGNRALIRRASAIPGRPPGLS